METKKTINICGVPHTITEHEDVFNVDTHFGMIDYAKCEIRINKNMPDASKQETLCHEVLHGILVHIGRNDLSTDEAFVQSLSNAIYQTFTPNVETRAVYEKPKVVEGVTAASNVARAAETGYTPCVLRPETGDAQI